MSRVTILDYGVGNLHSLAKALATAATGIRIESDPRRALETDVLVLPGVGAFGPAAAHLADHRGLVRRAILGGLPTLGICLGMQLLFEGSDEGPGRGLAVLDGRVTRLRSRRTPQIGWNEVTDARDPLLAASGLRTAYYANSFAARPKDASCVQAWTLYDGDRMPAVVRRSACVGVQFHPEKSSTEGLAFLGAFLRDTLTSSPLPLVPTR